MTGDIETLEEDMEEFEEEIVDDDITLDNSEQLYDKDIETNVDSEEEQYSKASNNSTNNVDKDAEYSEEDVYSCMECDYSGTSFIGLVGHYRSHGKRLTQECYDAGDPPPLLTKKKPKKKKKSPEEDDEDDDYNAPNYLVNLEDAIKEHNMKKDRRKEFLSLMRSRDPMVVDDLIYCAKQVGWINTRQFKTFLESWAREHDVYLSPKIRKAYDIEQIGQGGDDGNEGSFDSTLDKAIEREQKMKFLDNLQRARTRNDDDDDDDDSDEVADVKEELHETQRDLDKMTTKMEKLEQKMEWQEMIKPLEERVRIAEERADKELTPEQEAYSVVTDKIKKSKFGDGELSDVLKKGIKVLAEDLITDDDGAVTIEGRRIRILNKDKGEMLVWDEDKNDWNYVKGMTPMPPRRERTGSDDSSEDSAEPDTRPEPKIRPESKPNTGLEGVTGVAALVAVERPDLIYGSDVVYGSDEYFKIVESKKRREAHNESKDADDKPEEITDEEVDPDNVGVTCL